MTQGGKRMEEIRKTSCIKRVISMLLAVLMILVSVPISSLTASAWGGPGFGGFGGWGRPGWGQTPDVMTNVRAEFTDTSYHGTSEQESGELFYLYLSLAGNNVNHWGHSTTYRIDIPENLLLPDFPGQGLRDGAKYSGFTMHVEGNSRYLTYDIANGQTKAIYLKAKFANGKTPNGEQATVKITASGSGQSKTSTVTAKSKIAWDDSKSAGRDTISLSQLSGNNEIPYTLKAYPNYTSTKKGEWWVGAVEMTDVITLPDGLTFQSGANTGNIQDYLTLPNDVEITSASASGNTLSVTWVKKSTNTDAEMAPYTVNAALKTNMIEVGNFTSGKIHNDLTVRVQGVNSTNPDQWETLPKKSADVTILTPAPAKIDLEKSVEGTAGDDAASVAQYYSSKGYLVCGEYVLFKVEAANHGETAKGGTLTLTDVVPAGLTPVSGVTVGGHETDGTINGQNVTWTTEGLGVNETFTRYVVCKVNDGISPSVQSVRNAVYLGTPEQYESVAAAYVNIKKPSSSFSIAKSVDKSIYSVGDTLTYTITVSNTGEEDITFSSLTDAFNDETNLEIDKSNLPTGSFELAVGETKTFEIPVTVKEGKTGDITNTATATPEGGTPQSASATASQNAFSFGDGQFTKNVSSTVAIAKGSITYTLKYYNNSRYAGKYTENDPLIFTDDFAQLNDLTVTGVKLNGKDLTLADVLDANNLLTVKYSGDVPAYGSVTVEVTCQVAEGASGTIPANTATLSHGSDKALDGTSPEVEISDISFDVDKFAIADDGTIGDYKTAEDIKGNMTAWDTALQDSSVIQQKMGEGAYGSVLPGQRITFYIKITNTGETTLTEKNLTITDVMQNTIASQNSNVYIVDAGNRATFSGTLWDGSDRIGSIYSGNVGIAIDSRSQKLSIPKDGYIVVAYQVIAPDATNQNGSFSSGTNKVTVEAEGVTVEDSIQYKADAPQMEFEKGFGTDSHGNVSAKAKSETIEPKYDSSGKFSYDDTVDALKKSRFEYTIILRNVSTAASLYGKDVTLTDVIPDGMEFVEVTDTDARMHSVDVINPLNPRGKPIVICRKQDVSDTGTTLTFDLVKQNYATGALFDFDWCINNREFLMFKYTVKLTDTKAAQIATELQKQCADPENVDLVSELFQNKAQVTANKDVLIDGKPGRTITDTADLTLKQVVKKTAPGLTKAAYTDFKAVRADGTLSGLPIWEITVSNQKIGEDTADLTHIVLEDELAGGMQYAAGAIDTTDNPVNGYSLDGGNTWNYDLDNYVTVNGSKFTIDFKDAVKLAPNQSILIHYASDLPTATDAIPEKTYFNKTTLSTSEKIYQDRVTAGDLVDGKLEATASNSQGGVETTSFKTIKYIGSTESPFLGYDHSMNKEDADHYGQGNTPSDNYVEGLQGNQVEYKLYVTNDSQTNLKNFTVIDRLPFENVDIGLVSGYDRYSAFTVTPDINSITCKRGTLNNSTNGKDFQEEEDISDVKISYSSDKHSNLDEYAGDWRGESGNMNWQDTKTDEVVNLRFQFPSTFTVEPGETVCITFKGTIPDYVQNTGEENIAWNSFAYSYQYEKDGKLVETPMVAEPAKVGVWVPEVKDTVSLVVNKKYDSGQGDTQTFYFALFTAKTDGVTPTYGADGKLTNASEFTRYSSEIKPITVKDGETETATFTNIPASAKKNLYVFETDENGVIKDNVNVAVGEPVYGTDAKTLNPNMPESAASGDSGTKLTYKDEDTVAAVSFLNEIQYGKITVEKTFKSPFNTTDTFYFGLFYKTKDGAYVKYGDLQTVTLTGSKTGATDTVTFDEVPIQRNWYVLETDAKGNPVTDSYLDYKVTYGDSAGKDHAIKLDDINVPKTAKITNEESATYQIQATKVVNGEALTNESGTYRFALYSSDKEELTNDDLAGLTMVGTPQDVAAGDKVTFDNLKENTYYYLFELDSDGNILKQGDKATNGKTGYIVEYPNADTRETTDAETNTTTSTVYYLPTQFGKTDADEPLTVDDCIKQSAIQNREQTKAVTGSITVDKTVLQNSTKLTDWDDTFYVGLYVRDAEGNLKLYGDVSESVHTLTKDAPSTIFKNLPAKTDTEPDAGMYYIAECDDKGTPFSDGTNGNYTIYYNVNGSDSAAVYGAVLLDGRFDTAPTGAVSVTNKTVSVTRTLVKKDLADKDGAALTGAKFAIYTKLAYEAYQNGQETTLTAIEEHITDKITANLAENTEYVLVETTAPTGYATMTPISFTVNANGQIVSSDNTREDVDVHNNEVLVDTNVWTSELIAYDSKESTIIIGKYDITKQTELAGATLTLTSENDVDWSKVTLENSTAVLDENKKQIGIQWISTGTDAVIKGLPDGDYTLAETGSEFTSETDGKAYKVAEGTATFTLTDGTIANTTGTTDTVDADAADSYFYYNGTESNITLAVCDVVIGTTIIINKHDIDTEESSRVNLPDAKMKLTPQEGQTIDLSKIILTDGNVLTQTRDSIIWTTEEFISTKLENVPDGKYFLTEDAAPNGYTVVTAFSFEVKGGKVITASREDGSITIKEDENIISVNDKRTEVSISKVDAANDEELPGATLTLTNKDLTAEQWQKIAFENFNLSNENVDLTLTEDGNGVYWVSGVEPTNIVGLPAGTYTLTETVAPDGYAYSEDITFIIGSDGKVVDKTTGADLNGTVVMKDYRAELTISKKDGSDAFLAGATLQLLSKTTDPLNLNDVQIDGKPLTEDQKVTVDGRQGIQFVSTDAEMKITGLPAIEYELSEVSAPTDYLKSSDVQDVILTKAIFDDEGNQIPVSKKVVNNKLGELTIQKVDQDGNALTGATLQLKADDANVDWSSVKLNGDAVADLISAEDATVLVWTSTGESMTFKGLPAGTYEVSEVSAKAGYLATTQKWAVTVSANGAISVNNQVSTDGQDRSIITITNEASTIQINKEALDGGNIAAEEAEFKLTAKDEHATLNGVQIGATKITEDTTSATFKGNVIISALPDGTYELEEITAPNGFTTISTFTFVVKNGVVTTVSEVTNGEVEKSEDGKTLTIKDERSAIQIDKRDITGENEVAGATLTLTNDDLTTEQWDAIAAADTDLTAVGNGVQWTSSDAAKNIVGLPSGTYTLKEIAAPDGYAYAEDITFTVEKDGTITVDAANKDESGVIVMKDAVTKVSIDKRDITGENEVPEATLQVKDEAGKVVEEWTSSDKPHDISGKLIAGKTYTLHEENAPDGYAYAEDFTFTVEKDGTITVDAANKDENGVIIMKDDVTKVSIDKRDITGENEVPGATLQVKDEAGKVVEEWTSSDKPHDISGKLIAGKTYTLHEENAPDGYAYAEDITFTVEKNGTITVDAANKDENDVIIMKDDVTKVSISKKAMTGSDELAGAELKLYYVTQNDQGEVTLEVDAWTSGTEAHVIEGALIAGGTYKLVEITAPDGYQVAESITFTIDKTGKVLVNGEDVNGQVTMYDAALGDVVISKRAVNGTEELEGASLKITDADGKTVAEWVSEQTPKTIQLDAGTYTLTEETAPDGYTVAESIEFVVDAAGKVTVNGEDVNGTVLMEDDTTKVTISKKDITGDNEIPGATLQIKDENGDVVDEWTSSDKPHEINGKLIAGKEYTLHEEHAPDGYAYSEDVKFTVDKTNKVTEVTMKDDVTKVTISKKDITGDNEIPGATLQIKDENGDVVDEWTSTDKPHEINGKLIAGKEYTLHEENAPNGYAYSEDVKFTVDETGKVTEVTMKDDVTKVSISKKTLTGSDELAGAELKLYEVTENEQGETVETEVDAWTSGTEAHVINGKLTAGGTYKLVEITAPDGYQVAEAVTFTVNKDGTLTEVTMHDAVEGEIAISKQSVNSTEELEGAKLKITDATGKTVAEWVSEKTPKLVQLDAGTYTLTEETAPDGYVLAESMTFTVDKNGKVTVKNENGEDVDAGGIIVMKDNTTKVSISKQDITGDKEIPGAKLQVKDETGKVIEEWTSTNKPHEINEKLVAGKTYTLHEENAPDGYAYAEDVEFTVDEKGEVTTVVMKDAATEVSISKQDITGTTEVEGATLSILDENGEQVAKWISTKNAYVLKGVLNADTTYTLHEENAPDGYAYAEDITFTIDKTGKVTVNGEDVNGQVIMKDDVTKVTISKQSVTGSEEVPGATLQILDKDGKVVETWTSGDQPHEFTGKLIAVETYTLHEENAPEGYAYAEDITFTLDKTGNVTVYG